MILFELTILPYLEGFAFCVPAGVTSMVGLLIEKRYDVSYNATCHVSTWSFPLKPSLSICFSNVT